MTQHDLEQFEINSLTKHSLDRGDTFLEIRVSAGHDCDPHGRPLPLIMMVDLCHRQRHPIAQLGYNRLKNASFRLERPCFRNSDFDAQGCSVHGTQVRATSRTS